MGRKEKEEGGERYMHIPDDPNGIVLSVEPSAKNGFT